MNYPKNSLALALSFSIFASIIMPTHAAGFRAAPRIIDDAANVVLVHKRRGHRHRHRNRSRRNGAAAAAIIGGLIFGGAIYHGRRRHYNRHRYYDNRRHYHRHRYYGNRRYNRGIADIELQNNGQFK